jgi:hypothetical protein
MSGCGGSGLVKVTGQLTYKGQPVPSTWVIFHPDGEGKRSSRGLTDDAGNFKLSNSQSEMGAGLGHYTVTLKYHVSAAEETKGTSPKANKDLREVIAKYGNIETSKLKYEITHGGQNIEIKLD